MFFLGKIGAVTHGTGSYLLLSSTKRCVFLVLVAKRRIGNIAVSVELFGRGFCLLFGLILSLFPKKNSIKFVKKV